MKRIVFSFIAHNSKHRCL